MPEIFGQPNEDSRTAEVTRGVCRLFSALGHGTLMELTLANGRRVDVAVVTGKGDITIVEVKTSVADFRSDTKWTDYLDYCDRLYFAVPPEFPQEILPSSNEAGLIVADRFGGEILYDGPEDRLGAARRKAVTIRFAAVASQRLQRLIDPDGSSSTG